MIASFTGVVRGEKAFLSAAIAPRLPFSAVVQDHSIDALELCAIYV
jgi:hypothetical protein